MYKYVLHELHVDDAPTNAQTLKHSCIFSHKTQKYVV